jgi:hypothetical protein
MHYLHMEPESSLSKQMDRPKLKKTRMQNCVMADKLSERVHSFECITDLSNAQSTPLVTMNYPQWVDFHSNNLSVVRVSGPDFNKHFG